MGFSFHFSCLYPAPYIELYVCYCPKRPALARHIKIWVSFELFGALYIYISGAVLQQGATSKIYLMSNNGKQFLRAELGFVTSGIWVSIDCMNWMNEPYVTRLVGMNPGCLEADKQYCNLTSLMSDEISQNFILCPRSLMKCIHTT